MEVKFLDLKKINNRFENEFKTQFDDLLNIGHYILGSQTVQFEKEFAAFCQSKYCLGVANGLDALILIFQALINQKKLSPGDLVAVQGNTFIASAFAAVHCGLKIQILEPTEGFNLSISDVRNQISSSTRCLLLVHLYGEMKDTDLIANFCKDESIILIEDAAQSHGAVWSNKKAGSYGIATGFSFYPGKNLGALGDAGAVVTSDTDLFEEITYLRNYGSKVKYQHDRIGYNSRLDDIQSGFLSIKLKMLEQDNERRRQIAKRYRSEIKNAYIECEKASSQYLAQVQHLFILNTSRRDMLKKYLDSCGVQTLIHYPYAIFESKALDGHILGTYQYDLKRLNKTIISIPVSPIMTDSEVNYVIEVINKFDGINV